MEWAAGPTMTTQCPASTAGTGPGRLGLGLLGKKTEQLCGGVPASGVKIKEVGVENKLALGRVRGLLKPPRREKRHQ